MEKTTATTVFESLASGEALARRLGQAWDREDAEGNAVEKTEGIQRMMASDAFVAEIRGKTDALWMKWFGIKMLNPTGFTPYF